jgi:hypothetical protein
MAASPPARWRSGRSTPYRPGLEPPGSHDACFLPRCTPVTGDVQIHEMAYVGDELCFINTTRLSSKPRARSRDPAVNVYILRSVYYSTSAARLRYPTNRLGECPFAAGLDQLANGFPWELCCTASHLPLFLRASVRRHRSRLIRRCFGRSDRRAQRLNPRAAIGCRQARHWTDGAVRSGGAGLRPRRRPRHELLRLPV